MHKALRLSICIQCISLLLQLGESVQRFFIGAFYHSMRVGLTKLSRAAAHRELCGVFHFFWRFVCGSGFASYFSYFLLQGSGGRESLGDRAWLRDQRRMEKENRRRRPKF